LMAVPLGPSLVLLFVTSTGAAAPEPPYSLPAALEGTWEGVPHVSVAGPWSQPFRFSVSKTRLGDYLFEDNLRLDTDSPNYRSWQRTYFSRESGRLLHCPGPRNHALQIQSMMKLLGRSKLDDRHVTFCLEKWDGYVDLEHPFPFKTLDCYSEAQGMGCACFNWTMVVGASGETMHYEASFAAAPGFPRSRHMVIDFRRIGGPPSVDLEMPGEDGRNFTCDYGGRDGHLVNRSGCPFMYPFPGEVPPVALPPTNGAYPNCYMLNKEVGLVLEWSTDSSSSQLHAQVSAWAPFGDDTYIALGFRPLGGASSELARSLGTGREQRFGMRGADIVLGHQGGVRNLFANLYTGPPEDDDSLDITDGAVTFAEGRITLQFTRPLVGGRLHARHGINASIVSALSDMMWSVGRWDERSGSHGHGPLRGWREVNWTDPESDARPLLSLRPYRCSAPRLLL